jgi:hypothetical protein
VFDPQSAPRVSFSARCANAPAPRASATGGKGESRRLDENGIGGGRAIGRRSRPVERRITTTAVTRALLQVFAPGADALTVNGRKIEALVEPRTHLGDSCASIAG